MNILKNKNNWVPPTSFEEKIKHIIIPSKLYIRRLVLKEWIKGRTDIKFLRYLINRNLNSLDVGAYKGVYTYFISKYSRMVYAFEPNPKSYKILKRTVDKNYGKLKIETKKIDDLKLKNIGFIKIDAEGVELKVLKGAKKLIKKYKPNLLIEIEERYISEPIEKSLQKILNMGYRGFALIGEILTPLKFFDGDKNHRIDYGPKFHANAFIFVAK